MRLILTFFSVIIFSTLSAQESFLKYYDFKSEYGNVNGLCKIDDEIIGTGIFWDTFSLPPKQNIILFKSNMDGELINYKYFNDSDAFYLISLYGVLYIPNIVPISDQSFLTVYTNSLEKELEILMFDVQLNLINKKIIYSEQDYKNVIPINLMYWNNKIVVAGVEGKSGDYISYLYKINNDLNSIDKEVIPNIEQLRSFEYNSKRNEFVFSHRDNGKDRIVLTDTALNQMNLIEQNISMKEVIFDNILSTGDNKFLLSNSDVFGNDVSGYIFSKNISHFDQDFNKVWTFSMGGLPDMMTAVVNIVPSSDGAYFAYGQVGARVADIRNIYPSLDSIDIMMLSTVKFKDDGRILWQRFDTLEIGYYNVSYAKSGGMVAAGDGGLYVSGDVTWYDTIRVDGILKRRTDYKHFLMKIDSNGCVDGLHCNVEPKTETVLSVQPSFPSDAGKMTVYPNPSTGIVTVDAGTAATKGILTVYNVLGEAVTARSLAGDEQGIQLDLSGQPSGRYYITIRQDDGKTPRASFILVK